MKKTITLFLLFSISCVSIYAKEIKGKVSNNNTTLENVFIYLKNNPYSCILTDKNGEFVINLTGLKYLETDIIVFSHIGYETKEYKIEELSDDIHHKIILVESSIILEDVIVTTRKLSRRERKQRKISIIEQFKEQVERDFIFKNRTHKVVSDVEIVRDEKKVFHNRVIGEYKELIGVLANKGDSISLTYSDMSNYIDNDIKLGIKEMSDKFIDNNVISKRRKDNKRLLGSSFYRTFLSDSLMIQEALTIHKSLWSYRRNIRKRVLELDDNPKKWEIIGADNGKIILRYRIKFGFLGIVKYSMISDFIVDSKNYSLERIVDKVSTEINIPFGYRLPPDGLMLLNMVNANSGKIKKYRVRHLHVDATLNTIYKNIESSKYLDERSCDFNISVIDTKKRNIKAKTKALVKVLSIEDN